MLRGFAALYVVLYHFTMFQTKGWGVFALPLRLGAEAVMIFFLISGFVVCLSHTRHPVNFKTYFLKRALRIYPIFLTGLGLGVLTLLNQGKPLLLGELLGNLAMLQDASFAKPGTWFSSYAEIHTLWSLAYEWWFYMLFFPVWRFVAPDHRVLVAGGISALGLLVFSIVPNQICLYLMYFVLWWTGVEFAVEYQARRQVTLRGQRKTLLVLGTYVLLGSAVILWAPLPHYVGAGQFPWVVVRHFSAVLLISLGAFFWQQLSWVGFERLFQWFTWASPISYAVYIYHYPLGITGGFFDAIDSPALRICLAVVSTLGLAWAAENWLQPFCNRLLYVQRVPRSGL